MIPLSSPLAFQVCLDYTKQNDQDIKAHLDF
jgi:hypothetical protein